MTSTPAQASTTDWQTSHMGHWMRLALDRFDQRVMTLMARHPGVSLALSNLAARGQVTAAHLHITRHLPPGGMRLSDLAARAHMTKQAMGMLVNQCEAWGMVERLPDAHDARARRICFTPTGLAWLQAYRDCVAQAESDMRAAVGAEVVTVISLGLEAYASQ